MAVQDATGHITRTELSLADLALFTPGALPADPTVPVYDFVQDGLTPGATVKRRQIAESLYMDDAVQVQSSKARIPTTLGMFATGHDAASLRTNVAALLAAVDQSTWELHVLISGASGGEWAWSCWDAEVTVGFPVAAWYGLWMPVVVSTLRSPIPVAGPV
jgi:hypothetical protein